VGECRDSESGIAPSTMECDLVNTVRQSHAYRMCPLSWRLATARSWACRSAAIRRARWVPPYALVRHGVFTPERHAGQVTVLGSIILIL